MSPPTLDLPTVPTQCEQVKYYRENLTKENMLTIDMKVNGSGYISTTARSNIFSVNSSAETMMTLCSLTNWLISGHTHHEN